MKGSIGLSKRRGFTLLELLVALTLFGVISVALYSGLGMAVKSMAAGDKNARELRQVMALQTFLRGKLTEARGVTLLAGQGQRTFQGYSSAVEFVADVPRSMTQGTYAQYRIGMSADDRARPALRVDLQPYPEDAWPDIESLGEVELSNIRRFTLSYFGATADETEHSWHSEWLQQPRLPLLVKIEIATPSGLAWPAIVVAPQAAVSRRRL